jgi:hypothetical protein
MKKTDLPSKNSNMSPSPETNVSVARQRVVRRRSFLKGLGLIGAGAALPATGLLSKAVAAGRTLPRGDAAILRFLAAAEILESDLWEQYAELGGVQSAEFVNVPDDDNVTSGFAVTGGNPLYTAALQLLDMDMPQYIFDNTDDEISHQHFINAFLKSRGAATVNLEKFRTLPGSQATGANKSRLRLTNLMQLTVNTGFWTRYRIDSENPDLDPSFVFPQAATIVNRTAIPRTDADTAGSSITSHNAQSITDHLKAIAFTAGFHFAFIEQGGTTIYPSLAQRVTDPEVLRILLSIGPTETMHFQTWQDKAGNATPLTDVDPVTGASVTFMDLTTGQPESLQANLIMPEPCPFLSPDLPICSVIRPTNTKGAAMGAVKGLTADGLFIGQTSEFFEVLRELAEDADAARREG